MGGGSVTNPTSTLGFIPAESRGFRPPTESITDQQTAPAPTEQQSSGVLVIKTDEGDHHKLKQALTKVADVFARLTFPVSKAVADYYICSGSAACSSGNKLASLSAKASLKLAKIFRMGPDSLEKTAVAGSFIGRYILNIIPGTACALVKGTAVSGWNLLTLKSCAQAYKAESMKDLNFGTERFSEVVDKFFNSQTKIDRMIDKAVAVRKLQLGIHDPKPSSKEASV